MGSVLSWDNDGQREVTYWIGRADWGRGYATAAVRGFVELEGTRPLHAATAVDNASSQRVTTTCGFRVVGSGGHSPTHAARRSTRLMLRLDGPSSQLNRLFLFLFLFLFLAVRGVAHDELEALNERAHRLGVPSAVLEPANQGDDGAQDPAAVLDRGKRAVAGRVAVVAEDPGVQEAHVEDVEAERLEQVFDLLLARLGTARRTRNLPDASMICRRSATWVKARSRPQASGGAAST